MGLDSSELNPLESHQHVCSSNITVNKPCVEAQWTHWTANKTKNTAI